MPFTAAHPAAVLPLRRFCPAWLCWSSLVCGSVAPDLGYFLFLRHGTETGHTPLGTFYFCLPLALALLLVFHGVVKRPATLLLPDADAARLWPLARRPFRPDTRGWGRIVASVLLGSWSHLVWDSFTHHGRWGVTHLPLLEHTVARVGGYSITVYKLLQHGGTAIGLAALAAAYLLWRRDAPAFNAGSIPRLSPARRTWILASGTALTAAAVAAYAFDTVPSLADLHDFREFVGSMAVATVAFGGVTLMLASLLIRWRWASWTTA